MLIDAFYRCDQSIPCRLIIFGEGELLELLQEQVNSLSLNDKISFAGYVNNPIAEVKQADLYVLSSRFEGSPNAIVEAMSVNTRVVAFDCPHGAREILRDGDVAPLVDNKDVNALALSMLDELKKVDQPVELSGAVSRFSAANSAKEYRRLLLNNEN
jgi:glycosyltransferase involved in cell wall biosynthesis